jgi:hypothetical protein
MLFAGFRKRAKSATFAAGSDARNGGKNRGRNDGMNDNLASIFRVKLFRLLAINLAIGIAAALLMMSGLLLLNPYGLRSLILSDPSGATVLVLLLFGFIVTFGSAAMGSAIMAIGRDNGPHGGKGAPEPVAEPAVVALKAR